MRLSEDRVIIALREKLGELSTVLVSLCSSDNMERIFSKDIPCLIMQDDFLQH